MKINFIAAIFIILLVGCSNVLIDVNTSMVQQSKQDTTHLLEDLGDYYSLGGDILLDKNDENHRAIISQLLNVYPKGVKKNSVKAWPSGRIPYYYDESLGVFSNSERELIRDAMDYIESIINVTYELSEPASYRYRLVRATDPIIGGASTLGYVRNPVFEIASFNFGKILHELMHGLGFSHEHQRFDRDLYITINFSNIISEKKYNYELIPATSGFLGFYSQFSELYGCYDYDSIMHYPPQGSFAIDSSKPIIITTNPAYQNRIGQRKNFSLIDRESISRIYSKRKPLYFIGDFNGDGKKDILLFKYKKGWYVILTTDSGFYSSSHWTEAGEWRHNMTGDFNGDGKDDLMQYIDGQGWRVLTSTGTSFIHNIWSEAGEWRNNMVGDFNGDGKDDFMQYIDGQGWRVLVSTGDSFSQSIWTNASEGKCNMVGDFNGDGKDDFMQFIDSQGWFVMISTGNAFTRSFWTDAGERRYNMVGDFNGDSKDDFMQYIDGQGWRVLTSTGNSFIQNIWTGAGEQLKNTVGDFNGDGKDDFMQYIDGQGWRVLISNGSAFTQNIWLNGLPMDRITDILVGDFNGDRKVDVLQYFDQSWWRIWKSNGNAFLITCKSNDVVE